ncbi:MAG: erythromycin esterase family protein [Candidatus Saccharibacteria bacterium]
MNNIHSYPLESSASLDRLLDMAAQSRVVMLGEATHGTHQFYTWRSLISRRLIDEKGFSFIAVEGDWPDCYLINRFVKGYEDAGERILDILKGFDRWPTWMWANWEIAAFGAWLRNFNSNIAKEQRTGFYGLDVYSLWDSMHAIVPYLQKEDPSAVKAVKAAISCFEPYGEEGLNYARAAFHLSNSCRDKALVLLREIRKKMPAYDTDKEAAFSAEQNARIVVNAEEYYSSMIGLDANSWNIRDSHMMETLDHLLEFTGGKGIVWAHNSHVGDARATPMARSGTVNIGQLARQQYGQKQVFLLGFATYEGNVIASREWGAPMEMMEVPPSRKGSIEDLLHHQFNSDQLLFLKKEPEGFDHVLPHRAIGVVYHPEREKSGNYVPSLLPSRYDALIYLDKTNALHPLHLKPNDEKMPETYPFGL